MIIDAGITSERLSKSRNKYEFGEYAIKEGSFLFFMYAMGGWIQKGIQKLSQKYLKTPINLDLRFINSDKLKQAMKSLELKKELEVASKLKTSKEVLDYIAENPKSIIVEGAKISDIIGKFKNGEINPQKFINIETFKTYIKDLEEFASASISSDKTIGKFLKKAKIYKISAILANIGICCLALGYVMPKLMFEYRKKHSGTKDFHVANQVRARLEQTFSGK